MRMSKRAVEAMNRKRYGKSGRKPTNDDIQAAIERQKPATDFKQSEKTNENDPFGLD